MSNLYLNFYVHDATLVLNSKSNTGCNRNRHSLEVQFFRVFITFVYFNERNPLWRGQNDF